MVSSSVLSLVSDPPSCHSVLLSLAIVARSTLVFWQSFGEGPHRQTPRHGRLETAVLLSRLAVFRGGRSLRSSVLLCGEQRKF